MILTQAAEKLTADRSGTPLAVDESITDIAAGPAGQQAFTDLGGIDHLFRDPTSTLLHTVAVPLEQATSAIEGPWGGSRPGYLQHTATMPVGVDGQDLAPAAPQPAQPDVLGAVVARVRAWVGI